VYLETPDAGGRPQTVADVKYAGMPELRVFCPIDERARTIKNAGERKNGAQGRNRIVYDAIDLKRFFEWLFL
jgi:hypothetical protein